MKIRGKNLQEESNQSENGLQFGEFNLTLSIFDVRHVCDRKCLTSICSKREGRKSFEEIAVCLSKVQNNNKLVSKWG